MKELSIEEKARRYDEAIERAKQFSEKPYLEDSKGIVEYIFPELKESEGEKIRKNIISWLKNIEAQTIPVNDYNSAIAWLEKQGESKPIGKLQLSEELYEHIRNTCACIDDALSSETLADIYDYLSMAGRSANSAFDMIEKEGKQKPAEWSEEDLQMLQDVISGLEATKQLTYAHEPQGKAQMQERIDWLKSLKDRYTWKPSDEQMDKK